MTTFYIGLGFIIGIVFMLSIIGMLISAMTCYRLFDMKKIIAYCSILHLNLGISSLFTFSSIGIASCIVTSISHGLSSIGLFMLVGLFMNRSFTRFIDTFYFIDSSSRLVLIGLILSSLNFPSFYSFIAELLSMISIMNISLIFSILFVISNVLNAIFWFIIYNRKFYYSYFSSLSFSISTIEVILLSSLIGMMVIMGSSILLGL